MTVRPVISPIPASARLFTAAAFAIVLGSAPAHAAPTFTQTTLICSQNLGNELQLADLNHDGRVDLLYGDVGLTVRFGTATGSFGPEVFWPVAGALRAIAVGDMNGDGHPDVVATTATTVRLFRGAGDGSYLPPLDYGHHPNSMLYSAAFGDLNGDGLDELVVPDNNFSACYVYHPAGGTLGTYTTYPAGGVGPISVALADYDQDSKLDVALAVRGVNPDLSRIMVLRGDGAGGLLPFLEVATHPDTKEIVAAKLDADGLPDLLAVHQNPNGVSVHLGNGDGFLRYVGDHPGTASSLAIGDLDGDGFRDFVVAQGINGAALKFYRSHGDGTFDPGVDIGAGPWPMGVRIDDLDRNGTLDLVVTDAGNTLRVLLNQSTPTAAPREGEPIRLTIAPNPCRSAFAVSYHAPQPMKARIELLDLQGRLLDVLADGFVPAGRHRVERSATSSSIGSGLYFVRATLDGSTTIRRLAFTR